MFFKYPPVMRVLSPLNETENRQENFQAAWFYPSLPLAQAFVIWQKYGQTYSPAEALQKGTIFPELYRPYP